MNKQRDLTRQIKTCLPKEEWRKKAHASPQQWAWKAESLKNSQNKQHQQNTLRKRQNQTKGNWKNNHWNTQDKPVTHDNKENNIAPKWKYNQAITLASRNVRGMKEITKREQIILHMTEHRIYILCLQETNIPESNMERKDTHAFIFSSGIQGSGEHHGVRILF